MAAAGLLTAAGIAIRALVARVAQDHRQAGRDRMLSQPDDGSSPQPQRFDAEATGRYVVTNVPPGYRRVEAAGSPLESVVQRLEGVVLNMQSYATHEDIRRLEEQISRLSNKVDDYAADVVDYRRTSDRLARAMASLRHQVVDIEARQDSRRPLGDGTAAGEGES